MQGMFFQRVIILICLVDLGTQPVVLYGQTWKFVETSKFDSEETKVQSRFQSLDRPGLQNVFQVSDQLILGSGPEEKKSFESLKNMGIKTIISVDGAKPNLKLSREIGMKYVHIPIGYDGISEKVGLALARVAKELNGPFYIHYHHGRHRGPTAAAFVGLSQGRLIKKQAAFFWARQESVKIIQASGERSRCFKHTHQIQYSQS